MQTNRSFAEIFEELQQPETGGNSGWESHLDPFGMAQLIGELDVHNSRPKGLPRAYKAFKPRPAPRQPHVLTVDQAAAFSEFRIHSPHLPESFTRHELKSAYRQCALKTHPDRGGDSESFQLVKKSYHILEALVKS